jgi:hypothetical protein
MLALEYVHILLIPSVLPKVYFHVDVKKMQGRTTSASKKSTSTTSFAKAVCIKMDLT